MVSLKAHWENAPYGMAAELVHRVEDTYAGWIQFFADDNVDAILAASQTGSRRHWMFKEEWRPKALCHLRRTTGLPEGYKPEFTLIPMGG